MKDKQNRSETFKTDFCPTIEEGSLAYFLNQISDFRKSFGQRYSLVSLLSLIIWGYMSGCTSMRRIAANAYNYDQHSNGGATRS